MATSFNLQEYILFRTEIKRELTNNEVDTNFKMVANPWETTRIYEIGNIVYHPVIVDDPATTGEDQVLAWWRANSRTTQGVFDTSQWDIIGGLGSGNINIQGANGFGKIRVNSTISTGSLQSGSDAIVLSTTPNDTFNFIAGAGMQLQYNLSTKSIVVVNTLATNPGEINIGENIGTGAGGQDVYAGKVGVNLQFFGFNSTNTTSVAGNALTISTNATTKDIEYNFDEGSVDLAALNSGLPLITMLSDVDSGASNLDILQYVTATGLWTPTGLSSLATNIYTSDGTITASSRTVTLANGPLSFRTAINAGTGINIEGSLTTHLLTVKAGNGAVDSTMAFTNSANSTNFTIGIDATDNSFGIGKSLGLGGLTVDALSISTNSELYVPQIAGDSLTTTGIAYRIPLVSLNPAELGRFESSNNYDLTTYTDQGGSVDMISLTHEGRYSLKGVSEQNIAQDTSFTITSEHDFATNTNLVDGYGIVMSYNTPSTNEAQTIINNMNKTNRRFTGLSFNSVVSGMPAGSTVNKYIGSNISLDDMLGSTAPQINVGQLIAFSNTTGAAGTSPQRVGVYSNVVSDYTGTGSQDGELVLNELITDSGTWAGYFVGCVNIDQGGLVLPSSSVAPVCNGVSGGSVADRTLWINSANGHLMRGYVDVEVVNGPIKLDDLTDVSLPGSIADDSLLVYNSSSSVWEAATLAAYNLSVQALTDGTASIQLTDGTVSSDVDLIPGTGVTLVIDETVGAESITINTTATNAGVVPEHADNTAALAAGLSIGDFYRTGDFLKVVH